MWWPSPRLLLSLPALAALAGCGFRPLYGKSSVDPAVDGQLAQIRVVSLPDRSGQQLRNAVVQQINPGGEPLRPRYVLQISVTTSELQEAVQQDETASRDEMIFQVVYHLSEGVTEIDTGHFSRALSYDYLDQHYSNILARQDVQTRAASLIADQIRLELAAYFTRGTEMKARLAVADPTGPDPVGINHSEPDFVGN